MPTASGGAFGTAEVVNNLTTTASNTALDGRQGKKLQDEKAPLASPTFTGTVKVPGKTTAAINDGTLVATEAQVFLKLDATATAADSAKLGGKLPNEYEPAFAKNTAFNKKLGSETVQTVAKVATPTATASWTYPVQVNASEELVVNVPWMDTNTNTTYTTITQAEIDVGTGTATRVVTPKLLVDHFSKIGHTHTEYASAGHTHTAPTWDQVTGKPTTFTPATHTHTAATRSERFWHGEGDIA